jgi:hypothetical protein
VTCEVGNVVLVAFDENDNLEKGERSELAMLASELL